MRTRSAAVLAAAVLTAVLAAAAAPAVAAPTAASTPAVAGSGTAAGTAASTSAADPAASSAGISSGRPGSRRTLDLVSRQASSAQLDLGPAHSAVGLEFLSTDRLTRAGHPYGRSTSTCLLVGTIVSTPTEETVAAQCTSVLVLPDGQLVAEGSPVVTETGADPVVLAVTGGTGAYRGAGGQLTVTPVDEEVSRVHVQLDR